MKLRKVFSMNAISVAALMLTSCRYDPMVWKMDVPSPDGLWVAEARTDQWGGMGTAYVATSVSLIWLNHTVNDGKPFDIFSYTDGGITVAYKLTDANADKQLHLAWSGPSKLRISRDNAVDVTLQVTKFAGVDIDYLLPLKTASR